MAAGRYNPTIHQGATFQRDLTYTDSTGAAVDLTGATIRMQARNRKDSASTILDLSTATSGITITNATAGEFQILLDASTTAALDFGSAVYDLEIEFPSGEVRRVLEGTIDLRKEVTR